MGTTIGINTTILFASVFFIVQKALPQFEITTVFLKRSYYAFNGMLLLFFSTLLYAGVQKSYWMYFTKDVLFSEMQDSLFTTYIAFFVFGIGLVISIIIFAVILIKALLKALKS